MISPDNKRWKWVAIGLVILILIGYFNFCNAQTVKDSIPEFQNFHERGSYQDSIGTDYPHKVLLLFPDKKRPEKSHWKVWVWSPDVEKEYKLKHKKPPTLHEK